MHGHSATECCYRPHVTLYQAYGNRVGVVGVRWGLWFFFFFLLHAPKFFFSLSLYQLSKGLLLFVSKGLQDSRRPCHTQFDARALVFGSVISVAPSPLLSVLPRYKVSLSLGPDQERHQTLSFLSDPTALTWLDPLETWILPLDQINLPSAVRYRGPSNLILTPSLMACCRVRV